MEHTNFITAAYACARASFEAGQDALLVATASDYDAAGARAVVFDHRLNADLEEAMDSVEDQGIGQNKTSAYASAATKVEKLAVTIDKDLQGSGQPLRDALAYFQPKFERAKRGARHPGHWSEKSRRSIAKTLASRINDETFGRRWAAIYALQSYSTHPRAGARVPSSPENDKYLAIGTALDGVALALEAMDQIFPTQGQCDGD